MIPRRMLVAQLCFLTVLVVSTPAKADCPRTDNDTLALVNGKPITSQDFRERFELSIYPGKERLAMLDTVKQNFLFSMIAEQLLADEARKSGEFFTPEGRELERQSTDTYLRDALYRNEVMNKVQITPEEILNGMKKAVYKYMVDAFYFPDSSSASVFYRKCSTSRASELYEYAVLHGVPHDTSEVGFGEPTEPVENSFFGRKGGFLSMPVKVGNEFYVIRILRRQLNTEFTKMSPEEQASKIRDIIQSRKEREMTDIYLRRTLGDFRVHVDPQLLRKLVDAMALVLRLQKPPSFDPWYRLSPVDVNNLLDRFSGSLNAPIISVEHSHEKGMDYSISLGETIKDLVPAMFMSSDTSRVAVLSGLRIALRQVAQNSMLSKHARELGLQSSKEVRHNVDMILNAYYASQMRNSIIDTVKLTDSDFDEFLHKYYASALKNVFLKLQVFKSLTIEEAVDLLNAYDERGDSSSSRRESANRFSHPDTLNVNAYRLGNLGALLSQLEPGRAYGPLKTNEGYSVYRLLQKKTAVPNAELKKDFKSSWEIALKEKQDEVLYKYISVLAEDAKVKVSIDRLRKLKVTPIQMFSVRYIGFGGRISAVPGLVPCEGWVKYVPQKNTIFP